MSIRYPPSQQSKGNKRSASAFYEASTQAEKTADSIPSFGWLRLLTSPWLIIPIVIVIAIVAGGLLYYYQIFSKRIDRLLSGEIFTQSAGIYAAPKELSTGQGLSLSQLTNGLKRSGYVADTQQADVSRGRYRSVQGNSPGIEIEPSKYALVDGQKVFPRIRVLFNRSEKAVTSIINLDTGAQLDKALLEPELLSSITGKLREKRRVIGFKDLPPYLVKAITVTEDRSFFEHYGINIRGILRALIKRYDTDPNSPISQQGGSSITQQLVKNLLLSPERTLRRKLSEAYMSIILETRLSKEDIFALYCNEVYLGQQAGFSIDGVGEASEAYFNKDVTGITLPEAAYLAGLIRSPNRYNPYKDPSTATARRNQVLESMAEEGVISHEEADRGKATKLNVLPSKGRIDASDAPYFADFVEQQLTSIGADEVSAQHLRIYTTIDIDLQRAAYTAVVKQLNALDKIFGKKMPPGTVQAALVAMNANTGEIIAMVGGRDYERSQLNRVTEALRQTGSVYKPFVYSAALESAYESSQHVITPATLFMDAPQTFSYGGREYSPGNFGDKYTNQMMTLRDALVDSKNVITVQVATEVSMAKVVNLATRAGIPKPPYLNPALALGAGEATPLQVASAYTAFATGGTRVTPVAIKTITTGRGKLVSGVTPPPAQKNQVLKPDVAYVMTSFMKDVIERGTAAQVRARGFNFNVAGKTGTSRDGWFAGFTPNIVCVVWVGFDDGRQLGLTGATSALPIWADFMTAALSTHPEWNGDWQIPTNIQEIEINPQTGEAANPEDLFKRREFFLNNTTPNPPRDPLLTGDPSALPTPEQSDPTSAQPATQKPSPVPQRVPPPIP